MDKDKIPLPKDPKPAIHEGKKTISGAVAQLAALFWVYYEQPDLPIPALVFGIAACAITIVGRILAKVEL